MTADPLARVFGPVDVDDIATRHDVTADRLRTLVSSHQEGMAELPGVENLVYEWRSQFDLSVRHQSDRCYVVDAPAWAWAEFATALDASEEEMAALQEVHRHAVLAHDHTDLPAGSDANPMVLLRES